MGVGWPYRLGAVFSRLASDMTAIAYKMETTRTQRFFVPHILPNLNDIIEAAKQGKRGYQPYAMMKLSNDGWAGVRGFHDDFCVNQKAPGVHVTIVKSVRLP